MKAAVVDASVAVKWVVAEDMHENAMLLRSIGLLLAPAHWLAESANALWAKAHRGELTSTEAEQRALLLSRAPIQATPLPQLIGAAMRLANELALTVYDALYIALAMERVVPLVTADRTLFRRSHTRAEIAAQIIWLGDVSPRQFRDHP